MGKGSGGIIQMERAMKKTRVVNCMFNPKKGGVSSLGKIKCFFASWEQKTKKEWPLNPSERVKDVKENENKKEEGMVFLENFS